MLKPSTTGASDKLVWLGTNSGEYNTKSGYWTAMKTRDEENQTTNRNSLTGIKISGSYTLPQILSFSCGR